MEALHQMISAMEMGSEYDPKGHREIYDYISSMLLENEPASADEQTPHFVVFYAIRNILRPFFILGQIPDLLNLLAMVDTFRRHSVQMASAALSWQEYYTNEPSSDMRLLTERELKRINGYVDADKHDRLLYFLLVKNLCLLHVYYLVTSHESWSLAERLNDYFPGCFPGLDIPSNLTFHHQLSDKEKKMMADSYQECKEWLMEVTQWEEEQKQELLSVTLTAEQADAAFQQAFREQFPPPLSQEELVSNLDAYLNTVEAMIRKLEDYFPSAKVLERQMRAV
ncbi:uncharacterized protein EDB91DRAFT_1148206 [Suillus paluster]|uniref:uncharacterized protein n=1 Tax=Suillus paluster TaxID=48578 RepID=UPI001B861C6F|nr:uncharacterized protein EDB91DRAFT_1148206 [Suillus paluster]KAG1733585.1 hypothetical protein EDB91DRAFT_1148206 [Suillus paluster]